MKEDEEHDDDVDDSDDEDDDKDDGTLGQTLSLVLLAFFTFVYVGLFEDWLHFTLVNIAASIPG